MPDQDFVLEHSIEVDVSPTFAWTFRTDIATWDDPPATFVLDGPFADGSPGKTLIPGQEPFVWWVRDVQTGRSFTIEMPLDRATLRFEWYFAAVSARRTRLTQRVVLSGTNADVYRAQVEAGFAANLRLGMERLAASMAAAENASGMRS
jgi:hypothetical protein